MRYHGFVAIALCVLCAVGPAAHAQDSCSLVISARLETIGMPRQIGEIVRYHEEGNELLGKVVYRYHTKPIELPTETAIRFGGEVLWNAFPEDRIAFGIRYTHLEARSRVAGRVHSGDAFTWVKLWKSNIFPLRNVDAPGGVSPISYFGRDRIVLFSGDVFAAKKVVEGATDVSVSLGARLLYPRYELTVGETQQARLLIYKIPEADTYFNNEVTLSTVTESQYSFCGGPSIGATISHHLGAFCVDVGFNQSLAFGEAVHKGDFSDVDDVIISGGRYQEFQYVGSSHFSTKERVWLPATDLTLGVRYFLNQRSYVGISAFYSVVSNFSYGPTLAGPWDINNNKAPRAHEWSVATDALRLYGVTLSLGVVL